MDAKRIEMRCPIFGSARGLLEEDLKPWQRLYVWMSIVQLSDFPFVEKKTIQDVSFEIRIQLDKLSKTLCLTQVASFCAKCAADHVIKRREKEEKFTEEQKRNILRHFELPPPMKLEELRKLEDSKGMKMTSELEFYLLNVSKRIAGSTRDFDWKQVLPMISKQRQDSKIIRKADSMTPDEILYSNLRVSIWTYIASVRHVARLEFDDEYKRMETLRKEKPDIYNLTKRIVYLEEKTEWLAKTLVEVMQLLPKREDAMSEENPDDESK